MPNLEDERGKSRSDDLERVASEVANRLQRRGITVLSGDSTDDLAALLDQVESFELAVEEKGGDLMIAEPPEGHEPEPGSEVYALPLRRPDEPAQAYLERLAAETRRVRRG
jgi:hypothetical protein